jgi:hypothetical protein
MNWPLIVSIVIPILTLVLGVILNRVIERRAKLTTYLGHTSIFEVHPPGAAAQLIHMHSIVVTNVGGKAANTVRLSHHQLPDFYIWPAVPHGVEEVPQGGRDIVIPVLVPGQQITISYLYYPPVTWNLVNAGVRSDEGFAKALNVLPVRQFSKSVNSLIGFLMLMGTIATFYLVILLLIKIYSLSH